MVISGVVIHAKRIYMELDEKISLDSCRLGKASFPSVGHHYAVVSDKTPKKKKTVYWGFNNGMNGRSMRVIQMTFIGG